MDIIQEFKDKDPKLVQAGNMVLDCITMLGFVHYDFLAIRLKAFKQIVHPKEKVFPPPPQKKGNYGKINNKKQTSRRKEIIIQKELEKTIKVGGNTAKCLSNWEKVSNDPWVLSAVQRTKIPLKIVPFQGVEPRPISWRVQKNLL